MKILEKKIAEYFGRKFCLLTGSGTTAIYLILRSCSKEGGKVLFPAVTCMAPVNAAMFAGMTPVFCDINLKDFTMDEKSLKKIISEENIDIIVPTHLFGHICDMDMIRDVCQNQNIFILEDAAQAVGATYKERKIGSFGNASVISFGHTKILDCGGGGAVLTDDKAFYLRTKNIYETIPEAPHNLEELTLEYRKQYYQIMREKKGNENLWNEMLSLQMQNKSIYIYQTTPEAELCIEKNFDSLENILKERAIREKLYENGMENELIIKPCKISGSTCWRYTFLFKGDRDKLLSLVRDNGIDISSWYPSLHKMYSKQSDEEFVNAKYFEERVINLWVNSDISIEKIGEDIKTINKLMKEAEII